MPTLKVGLDASGAARGAGMFHTHARTVTRAATEIGMSTGKATKKIKGMGGALGGIGKLISGIGIFYLLQRVARGAVTAAVEQEKALAQLRIGLESTGGVSGQTMTSMQALSAEMMRTTTFADELVDSSMAVMLSFTQIADDVFPRAIKATADIATRMGTDLQSATIQVAKALNDPIANLGALSRAGIQFSKAQKVLIKDLVETGKMADAQRLILEELENQYGGSAIAARNTLGGAIAGLRNEFGELLEMMVDSDGLIATFNFFTDAIRWVGNTFNEMYNNAVRLNAVLFAVSEGTVRSMEEFIIFTQALDENAVAVKKAKEAAEAAAIAGKKRADAISEQTQTEVKAHASVQKMIAALEEEEAKLALSEDQYLLRRVMMKGADIVQIDAIKTVYDNIQALKADAVANKEDADAAEELFFANERIREELEALVRTPVDELKKKIKDVNEAMEQAGIDGELWFQVNAKLNKQLDDLGDSMSAAADAVKTSWDETAESIAGSVGDTFADIILGTASVGDALESMLKQITRMLLQELVIKQMVSGLTGLLTPAASGLVFSGGSVVPMAGGGVVNGPTAFPMSGGRTGLMGEAGPEAVMPLSRDKSGKLGVKVEGGGAIQNFTFNITTPDADSFRRSQGQILADMRAGASRIKE